MDFRVMGSCVALVPVLLLLSSLQHTSEAGRVLVYPVDGSHWLNMRILVEALHTQGHQVTILRSSTSWYVAEHSPHYTSITVPQAQPQNIESQEFMAHFLKRSLEIQRGKGSPWAFLQFCGNLFSMLRQNQEMVAELVVTMFENQTLMTDLKEAEYDLVLTDPVFPAGVLVAHYLQLPLVLNVRWHLSGEGHFAIAPSPLSYVPQIFSRNSDLMNFAQRLSNIFYHCLSYYMYRYVSNPPYQAVCDRYFAPEEVDVISLIQGADLWLMRVDFVFEFPRPTMPNVVYTGGFQCKLSKPLPAALEEFVQSSGEHGVVVMSLGTLLGGLGPEMSEVIASAFARLPQKVVWRHLGERPLSLGNNTLLVKWLPQNDLLGHPKTKVFVTHGGTNGIYEAIYHGVPLLGIPLIFDQFDNMVRMKARGVAEVIEVTTLEVEFLTQTLMGILDEEKPYRENMRRLSRLHHDRPIEPLDSAIFWLEFVMRHKGAAHLRTESYKMPWYVYHNVDVLALLLGSALLVLVLLVVSCMCLVRGLRKRRKSKLE
ncbi:UDP-glucuronosyltransferase 2A2-like isoform X1 [Oncorhynchus nerka]|uniref:UDP-glucuronosyltransferase 2A2-like isoform X1 n=2 Tax=Oncorhynchus nerka TaxID=8023 RepID=UPI001130941D|nr:UDP-glucuronosyltransferase 2A2-like [Oncorhynchus nerka]